MLPNPIGGIAAMQYSSKSDIVCAMLRELIISGELTPSEPLRQRDLAQRFGVSQTPVREALRRLESEGLVANDPHRGSVVIESRSGAIEENMQIRAALEPLGARLAARAVTPEQIENLRALNEQMRTLDNEGDYGALNREFHFAVYQAADSPMLVSLMRLLWQAMPDGPKVRRSHAISIDQHEAIIDSLVDGDEDGAAENTKQHILGSTHLESERKRSSDELEN